MKIATKTVTVTTGSNNSTYQNEIDLNDMAKELDVSEDYLNDAICSYRAKYGTGVKFDEYFISFEPQLSVCEFKDMNFYQQI